MTRFPTLPWRSLAAGAAIIGTLGACGLPASGDWRTKARCQPAGGGWSPEQVLPDRAKCPEAYVGNGGAGWTPGLPGVESGPSDPWQPAPAPPCSKTESLNGFPCHDVDPHGNPGPYYP